MQDNTRETVTFRNKASPGRAADAALGSFLPGTGLGGAAVHWNGQTYRFQDSRPPHAQPHYRALRQELHRSPDLLVQDWGVTAADMEPYYDRFEYLLGVSGQAGNLKGRRSGGNPFEDPRSREYPTPPQKEPYGSALFRKAAAEPRLPPVPAAVVQPEPALHQPRRHDMNTCMFCGFCERYGCEHYAKSSPQTMLLPVLLKDKNFTLRTQCQVLRINLSSDKKTPVGVTYVDAPAASSSSRPKW
jgi:gluconate 2-dehydrogenase alpha chain